MLPPTGNVVCDKADRLLTKDLNCALFHDYLAKSTYASSGKDCMLIDLLLIFSRGCVHYCKTVDPDCYQQKLEKGWEIFG